MDSKSLRRLLLTSFSDQELRSFCFDYFRPVYDDFSTGMSKSQMVQSLLEYSARRPDGFDQILSAVKDERPELANVDLASVADEEPGPPAAQPAQPAQPVQPQITGPLKDRAFIHKATAEIVQHLQTLHAERGTDSLPLPVLLPELDLLFDCKTFRFEAITECTEQAWDRRLHHAYQIQAVLTAYQRNVRDTGSQEQYQLYRQVIDEVNGYTMHMGVFLFEAAVVEGEVEAYIGTEAFFDHMPKRKVFPRNGNRLTIPEDIDQLIDSKRLGAIQAMDTLCKTIP